MRCRALPRPSILTAPFFGLVLATVCTGLRAESIVIQEAQTSLIQNTTIAAPISGVIKQLHAREGQSVQPGFALILVDDSEAEAEFSAAQAAHEAARVEAENDVDARYARRTLEVNQRELEQSLQANQQFAGAISGTEMERLRLVVDQAALAIEQAEHQLQIAEARAREKAAAIKIASTRLRKHRVTSPVEGIVAEVSVEPGEWVEQGKPMLRLISLNPLRVECFVDGRRYGRELEGSAVEFQIHTNTLEQGVMTPSDPSSRQDPPTTDGDQGDSTSVTEPLTLRGTVTFVSPELHSVTGQARLWAELDNSKGLARAGMRGSLKIERETNDR